MDNSSTAILDQAEEEILSSTASDEALEAAAGADWWLPRLTPGSLTAVRPPECNCCSTYHDCH
jgi:hypothetical protein